MQDASGRYLQPEGAAAAADREAHFAVLSSLACRLAAGAKPTAPAAAAGGPAPPESLRRLLAAATASEDAVLQHLLFRDLISAGHGAMLVATVPQSMALERHLLALGHDRPYVIPWAQLGRTPAEPLTHAQLQHTALLKDLYIARRELRRAVDVLTALGHAHVDTAVEAAARPDRVRCFESAVFHVRLPLSCATSDSSVGNFERLSATSRVRAGGMPRQVSGGLRMHLAEGLQTRLQAKTLRDDGLASRLETEWWLALLQQELLVAVEARLEAAQREGGGGGAPVDTLRQKRQTLQLQSLSATEMFNGVAKVRCAAALSSFDRRSAEALAQNCTTLPLASYVGDAALLGAENNVKKIDCLLNIRLPPTCFCKLQRTASLLCRSSSCGHRASK